MRIHSKPDSIYFGIICRTLSLLVIVAVGLVGSKLIDVPGNCSHDEEYRDCANLLNPTCADLHLDDIMVSRSHCKYACACKEGFVRPVPGSKQCIPKMECPKNNHESLNYEIDKYFRPLAGVKPSTRFSRWTQQEPYDLHVTDARCYDEQSGCLNTPTEYENFGVVQAC